MIQDSEKKKAAQQRANEKRAGKRARGWACIVYPESAPDDWVEKLREGHVQTLISPLHDSDKRGNGEAKKPHWHVLAMYEGPVSDTVVAGYFGRIGVTAPPERVESIKGYARYLVHLDDHDKAKYSPSDVVELGGVSWSKTALDEAEEVNSILDEIETFIEESGCLSYAALCRYARAERVEWTRVIRKNTIHLTQLLKSMKWEFDQMNRPRV